MLSNLCTTLAHALPASFGCRDGQGFHALLGLLGLAVVGLGGGQAMAQTVSLSTLDLSTIDQGWGDAHADRSVDDHPLSIGGQAFDHGIGTHAPSAFILKLDGQASRLTASVGVDDETDGKGSVRFYVFADQKQLWSSDVLHGGDAPESVDLPLDGVGTLYLVVTPAGDGIDSDHADWADAVIAYTGQAPRPGTGPEQEAKILTPAPPATPRINGPTVFGVRPGSPVLYTVPATGDRPMTFSAQGLPDGVHLDAKTGRLTGKLDQPGKHTLTLHARNAKGQDTRELRLVVGDGIALTPPMGWNSWNCWAWTVDQDKVLRSAKAMVSSGLARHGWTYINIDDTWQGRRDDSGAIQPGENFPDMKGLVDQIHGMGLKAGIYSSPWEMTYAGHVGESSAYEDGHWPGPVRHDPGDKAPDRPSHRIGKHSFVKQDARQWAHWGIDYLKYDWNPNDVPNTRAMSDALRATDRDIVYSLSNSAPFDNAMHYVELANAWRTTGDIRDTWASVSGIGFNQDRWAPYAGPGHWNDPDMLVVGYVGWGPDLHPSRLTPNEQYAHISLWSLLSAPMLLGCDLQRLDEFTLSLLTNDEVIAVNQDPRGQQATCIAEDDFVSVYAKDLDDGSKAVGIFNRAPIPRPGTIAWDTLGVHGKQAVRDLWRQKDLGTFADEFKADAIPPHGVLLLRVTPAEDRAG